MASVLAAAVASVACGAPARRLPPPSLVGATAPVAIIPFELFDKRININATVNGEPGWLILDTGSSGTLLDRAWALRAGVQLPWAPDSNRARVDSMHVEGLVLRNYIVALYSTRSISERSGRFVAGLLGRDYLAQFAVEIDYPARVVRLYDRASYRYDGPGLVLPFASNKDDLVLNTYLQAPDGNWTPARLLLDTGNGSLCVILMTPYVDRQHLSKIRPVVDGPLITGLVGPLRVAVGNLPALMLGGVRLDSVPTALGRERRSILALKHIDGLAGNRLFHGDRLILDFARHRAIVDPAGRLGRECAYDRSGLTLTATGAAYRDVHVNYVVPDSPAADAGIQAGDVIVAIDSRPTHDMELPEIREAFAVDDADHDVRVLRGADTMVVTIHLRRLF